MSGGFHSITPCVRCAMTSDAPSSVCDGFSSNRTEKSSKKGGELDKNMLSKISGKGELPIDKMPGFREPDESEAEEIEKRLKKILNRDTVTTAAWSVLALAFTVMYCGIFIARSADDMIILVAAGIFFVITLLGIGHILRVDVRTLKAVKARQYTLRETWIDHVVPGFSTVGGKAAAKIRDENGHVYSHEFTLNRKLKKINKEDPQKEFLVIRMQTGLYCLLNKVAVQEEEGEDEEIEVEEE